jgi:hypothetical protein
VKAGYAWEYGLLAIIPVIGTIWFFIFAFDKWPIQETVQEYEKLCSTKQEKVNQKVISKENAEPNYVSNFCSNCGNKLASVVKFCSSCGNKIE